MWTSFCPLFITFNTVHMLIKVTIIKFGNVVVSSCSSQIILHKTRISFLQELQCGNIASSHRNSFSSTASDSDRPRFQIVEPPYSFVGMHCVFDQSKASGTYFLFYLYTLSLHTSSKMWVFFFEVQTWLVLLQSRFWSSVTWTLIYLHMEHRMEHWQYALSLTHHQSSSIWKAIQKMLQVGLAGTASVVSSVS